MFKNGEILRRRIARTWSGIALLLGALMLAVRVTVGSPHGLEPAAILLGTWFLAFVVYRAALERRPTACAPDRLARASLIVPTLGLLAVLPLTLHLPFFALAGALEDFGEWVELALVITAPTTILAGILIAIRGNHLVEGREIKGVLRPWAIYGLGVAALGPGWALVIPGVLIALTALPFVPVLVHMETAVARERAFATANEIPEALARFKASSAVVR
jgi:hypothetical protein